VPERTKTLLVVDDDQEVRELETEILCQQGYAVLQAQNAAEALRVAAATSAIDLLITDLAMPEADGLELTRQFRAVHPETPVLVVSGSLPLLRAKSDWDSDRFGFLPKPFQLHELIEKVRALLDAAAPRSSHKSWCCD
jgi:two-component system cell cycle sensor histidine kinase/response regulator CckA